MNRTRIREVANAIEAEELMKLDIRFVINSCGTAGCIAGFVGKLYAPEALAKGEFDMYPAWENKSAQSELGLTFKEAYSLFCPKSFDMVGKPPFDDIDNADFWPKITPRMAVRALRRLARTGKVEYRWKDA